MRVVIQRVTQANVKVDGEIRGEVGPGLLVLMGVEDADGQEDIEWMSGKIVNLRVFDDENGVMNRSVIDTGGDILLISQFTLHASTKKGNRPSFIKAARPEQAIPLYEYFVKRLRACSELQVETGVFGADMKVALVNDGPVTICIDSKNKE